MAGWLVGLVTILFFMSAFDIRSRTSSISSKILSQSLTGLERGRNLPVDYFISDFLFVSGKLNASSLVSSTSPSTPFW